MNGRRAKVVDSDLAVCFVGNGTHGHAVRVLGGEPETRPICGSGRKRSLIRVCWSDEGWEDAWEEDAWINCGKCERLMAGSK